MKDGVKVNKEAYEKATRLNDDIRLINYRLREAKKRQNMDYNFNTI